MKTWLMILGIVGGIVTSPLAMAQDEAVTEVSASSGIRQLTSKLAEGARKSESWGWSEKEGLWLKGLRHTSAGFWVAGEKTTVNGVLRATLKMGKHPDSSVFFRAKFPEELAEVSGYSVTFDRNYVQLHRWEEGHAQPIADRVKIKKMPPNVEIIITMNGGHTDVSVQDAATHKVLQKLSTDDVQFMGTETGYRVHRKQDKKSALTGYDFKASADQEIPDYKHPDAYTRQHPAVYVLAPHDKVKSAAGLKSCKPVTVSGIKNYDVFKCNHGAMMSLVNEKRLLPDGFYWTEPRVSFTDLEYRKASLDMNCEVPMHCKADAPIDPNRSAKDADMVRAYIDEYVKVCKKRIRNVRVETIGQTYLGHDIRAIVLSETESQEVPRVLFNGAHHGMELLATDMAFDILEEICETRDESMKKHYHEVLSNSEVWVIPLVNYDGNDLYFHVSSHLGRKNGRGVFKTTASRKPYPAKAGGKSNSAYYRYHPNDIAVGAGVDINRNYPLQWGATGEKASSGNPRHYWYRGTAPGSEPEIQSMMNLFHAEQFAASISFHTVSTKILSPYSIDALKNPPHEQDNAWKLALRMAEAAGVQASGRPYEVVKNLYSVDGTDQDWFRMMSGTYAYLIEGSLHNPTGSKRRDALEKNRPAWQVLLDAVPRSTIVYVRDTEGKPLIAEVQYSDEPLLNGERWLTRCEDGSHTMLCFGKREVTVILPDGQTQTKRVECSAHHANRVEFVFQRPEKYDEMASTDARYQALMGIDATCDLRNHTCPHLPALRYCLIDNACVPAGQTSPKGREICKPAENNRGWSKR